MQISGMTGALTRGLVFQFRFNLFVSVYYAAQCLMQGAELLMYRVSWMAENQLYFPAGLVALFLHCLWHPCVSGSLTFRALTVISVERKAPAASGKSSPSSLYAKNSRIAMFAKNKVACGSWRCLGKLIACHKFEEFLLWQQNKPLVGQVGPGYRVP